MIVIAIRLIFFNNQRKHSYTARNRQVARTSISKTLLPSCADGHRYHIIAILVIDGHEQLGQTLAVCNNLTQAIDKAANQ